MNLRRGHNMKDYIKQFYSEGFATTFYLKPIKFLEKNIKNKKVVSILSFFIRIIYTILVLAFAGFILYYKLKK